MNPIPTGTPGSAIVCLTVFVGTSITTTEPFESAAHTVESGAAAEDPGKSAIAVTAPVRQRPSRRSP